MELLEALRTRRSVKSFDPSHEITDDEVRTLFENVALAPTSFNMQNWHFVAVRNKKTREKLCAASWHQSQVKDASLVVVCCGALQAHRATDRYLRKAPEAVREKMAPMIGGFYESNDDLCKEEACRTIGIGGMAMMLMAREMGYDSCPMIGYDPKQVSEIVGLDDNHPPLMMVTIGKPLQPARPRMGLLDLEEFVSIDRFGEHSLTGEIPDHS